MQTQSQSIHEDAVRSVCKLLRGCKYLNVKTMPKTNCRFDVLVDDYLRIEVKSANLQRRSYSSAATPSAQVNLQRHGHRFPDEADLWWIIVFPQNISILLFEEETPPYTLHITETALRSRWREHINRFDKISLARTRREVNLKKQAQSLADRIRELNTFPTIAGVLAHFQHYGELSAKTYATRHRKKNQNWFLL